MLITTYIWQGIDVNGLLINGEITAVDSQTIVTKLQQQNITPLKIKKQYRLHFIPRSKITTKEISTFFRELAILINANISLIQAFIIIARDTTNKHLQTIIMAIKNEIEKGQSLSTALKKYPRVFNPVCCNLINIGEKSGTLDTILNHLANHAEKSQLQKQRLIKALFYPTLVFIVATIVTSVLLIFVVPQFNQMFANFGATLPLYTRGIIQLATYVKTYGLLVLGIISVGIVVLKYAQKHSPTVARKIDNLLLRLPYLKKLIIKHNLAQIMRTVGLAFKAGVPLLEALNLSTETVRNLIYQQALITVAQQITQGKSLHLAISENALFPERVVRFITIGEESGTLDEMLLRLTEHYEMEIKNITENINNLLEPLITILLGIIIGGIVIGMYLPIFSLGKII